MQANTHHVSLIAEREGLTLKALWRAVLTLEASAFNGDSLEGKCLLDIFLACLRELGAVALLSAACQPPLLLELSQGNARLDMLVQTLGIEAIRFVRHLLDNLLQTVLYGGSYVLVVGGIVGPGWRIGDSSATQARLCLARLHSIRFSG